MSITLKNGKIITHDELVSALIKEENATPERAESIAQLLEMDISIEQLEQYIKENKKRAN